MKTEARDVFKFRIYIDDRDILNPKRTIYTNMFPKFFEPNCPGLKEKQEIVKNKYFTKEQIQKIKEELCKKIMEPPLLLNV